MLAKENAKSSGILHPIQFVNGNLFAPFRLLREREPFNLILSNPPYIIRSEMEELAKEVRDYEPIIALNGGEDGLTFYRNIILQAPFYLKKGGWLLLEVGQAQGEKVSELIEKRGDFLAPQRIPDLSGRERVVKAQKK
jgi:release factor glutamine methyltransferase